jgi:hypothetical protein
LAQIHIPSLAFILYGPFAAVDLRRIPILKRLIADCDRLAADLEQEVRNEEDRVKIHDPADVAYSTYATATALRSDNLRRSADELRAHLAEADGALRELASPLYTLESQNNCR